MKLKFIIISGFLILAGSLGVIFAAGVFSDNSGVTSQGTPVSRNGIQASLSGFKPGSHIDYTIISSNGPDITGKKIADDHGQLDISAYDETLQNDSILTYNLVVNNKDNPLGLMITMDARTDRISVSGDGLAAFTDIEIESGLQKTQSRTDWAGLFSELDAGRIQDLQDTGSFQVALYDHNIARDVAGENPLLIKILAAPGGGGPTGLGVNVYFTTFCGSPPLSVCNTGAMNAAIQNIVNNYVRALMLMTEQLSAVMIQHVTTIGTFLDAKQQLETQRDLQALQAEAHKDYHPSEQMCRIGSMVKSMAGVEEKAAIDKMALNEILVTNYRHVVNASSTEGYAVDVAARLRQYREVYCDPSDNNNGLQYMCQHDLSNNTITGGEQIGGTDPERFNKDIDFVRTAEMPLTLDIDYVDGAPSDDEEDIIALAKNLYWPRVLEVIDDELFQDNWETQMEVRQALAMNTVAHNSFINYAGMKARSNIGAAPAAESGPAFIKALMLEFGLSTTDIDEMLGEHPSYYAQMDVLTKKMFQDPDFYTNLYDKPANVDRIGVSLEALQIMQARDHYEAALRREMLLSLLVEQRLMPEAKAIIGEINSEKGKGL